MGFRLLPRAIEDIEAIASHIQADNPAAAARWVDGLYQRFVALGSAPGMGVHRPEIGARVRLFPVGAYLILYHEEPHGVDIIRVVHGRRDPENWL
jgi:toxin ParE1/3/4